MNPLVKICGITTLNDALKCLNSGCFALGFNFYKKSRRYIKPDNASKIISKINQYETLVAGVFVDSSTEEIIKISKSSGINTVQLHGNYSTDDAIKIKSRGYKIIIAIRATSINEIKHQINLFDKVADIVLIDYSDKNNFGGSGKTIDSQLLKGIDSLNIQKIYLIAGGINPSNAKEIYSISGAHGIDLAGGIENKPGVKSHELIDKLFNNLKN